MLNFNTLKKIVTKVFLWLFMLMMHDLVGDSCWIKNLKNIIKDHKITRQFSTLQVVIIWLSEGFYRDQHVELAVPFSVVCFIIPPPQILT